MLQSLDASKTFNCPFPGGQIKLSDTLVCLHLKAGLRCPLPNASTHNSLLRSHATQQPPVLSPTLCTQPSRPGLFRVTAPTAAYTALCCCVVFASTHHISPWPPSTHSTALPCIHYFCSLFSQPLHPKWQQPSSTIPRYFLAPPVQFFTLRTKPILAALL